MPHSDIPNMLGRVLSGTKYGVKQTRGKFGLGAKMALIWSKMTTGLPFTISSAQRKQDFRSNYELDIDIIKCASRPSSFTSGRTVHYQIATACPSIQHLQSTCHTSR
eukprot:GHUV01035618.1.p1 GENE.GHUV01035618.1~~GHUV01035618.1.p1  ORF type:complete len:107 (-),score=24.89 GHUV01035618.1:85-405(-)